MPLGILGYGSIVSNPGDEIRAATIRTLDAMTPFCVEYARASAKRADAPTVVEVPANVGCQVRAKVFVLGDRVTRQQALDMLYRRERDDVGNMAVTYVDARQRALRDGVVIDSYRDHGLDAILYTTLKNNLRDILDDDLPTEQKGLRLAEKANESLTQEQYVRKRDGIQYLADNIDQGIVTPLTESYSRAIIAAVPKTSSLRSARLRLAAQRFGTRMVAGVDGCKAGWFSIWGDGGSNWAFGVFADIESLWRELDYAGLILTDIPIGLPFDGPRACDVEARRYLGRPRASSVFPPPRGPTRQPRRPTGGFSGKDSPSNAGASVERFTRQTPSCVRTRRPGPSCERAIQRSALPP